MAEVVPYGNKSKTRRSARISKIKIAKDSKESSLLTVPPGFEQKRKDQGVLHEGSKNHEEEKSVKAPEIEGYLFILLINFMTIYLHSEEK